MCAECCGMGCWWPWQLRVIGMDFAETNYLNDVYFEIMERSSNSNKKLTKKKASGKTETEPLSTGTSEMEPILTGTLFGTGTETKNVIPISQQDGQSEVVIMNSDKSRILRTLPLKESARYINKKSSDHQQHCITF